MRIGKIAGSAEYRMGKQFRNCQFLEPNCEKKSKNLLIFQFGKFQKISVLEILKFSIFKIVQFGKLLKFHKFSVL